MIIRFLCKLLTLNLDKYQLKLLNLSLKNVLNIKLFGTTNRIIRYLNNDNKLFMQIIGFKPR
jgi:hypothetical protein